MKTKHLFIFLFFNLSIFISASLFAQTLKPGFDKEEYKSTLAMVQRYADSAFPGYPKEPAGYRFVYFSPEMGLKNKWGLWKRQSDGAAVINIRGTIQDGISWMSNFYCGMVPAKGSIKLKPDENFEYNLSDYDHAYVHIGWLISFAYLSKDMRPKIDSLIASGTKSFIVSGHSQGGALSYFVTAWLRQLQKKGAIPKDVQIKTYCSAAPKPGNIYFAYDYESQTQDGWAYNVINSADWVPETPFSLQTVGDLNDSPLGDISPMIKKQKFPKNLIIKSIYKKLKRRPEKAVKSYRKYLGNFVGKMITKYLNEYEQPNLEYNMYYARAGNYITLLVNTVYYEKFPKTSDNKFMHHSELSYLYLLNMQYPEF
ncbi:lipase family protein [Polluticaenibacter yanchengensis]|uniref:Lipase family protein n=1 Tax=Polluticaenibacter yanchengensis TaxID=3014562 RepID=A0ABT4UGC9_9BACT|nr:lipase family protein [Chitinophagaceae bacterium LY-5]